MLRVDESPRYPKKNLNTWRRSPTIGWMCINWMNICKTIHMWLFVNPICSCS